MQKVNNFFNIFKKWTSFIRVCRRFIRVCDVSLLLSINSPWGSSSDSRNQIWICFLVTSASFSIWISNNFLKFFQSLQAYFCRFSFISLFLHLDFQLFSDILSQVAGNFTFFDWIGKEEFFISHFSGKYLFQ